MSLLSFRLLFLQLLMNNCLGPEAETSKWRMREVEPSGRGGGKGRQVERGGGGSVKKWTRQTPLLHKLKRDTAPIQSLWSDIWFLFLNGHFVDHYRRRPLVSFSTSLTRLCLWPSPLPPLSASLVSLAIFTLLNDWRRWTCWRIFVVVKDDQRGDFGLNSWEASHGFFVY